MSDPGAILLYDGICGLCDRVVQFVLPRDKKRRIRFATLQGETAASVLPRHGQDPAALDTFHLVLSPGTPNERVLSRGRGGARVLRLLGGAWGVVGLALAVVPTFLLDFGYGLVAKSRYRVFGKLDACRLPAPDERERFLP
jgi:predicted DCC family thiol-disulfide oxidoreductase YuxK